MTGLATVVKKELKCFAADRGQLLNCAIISVLWSFAFCIGYMGGSGANMGGRSIVVFSAIIVGAGFSGTVFISERVSGTLEVLITSGVSRDAVLFGKMFFVLVMSAAMGALCAVLASVWGAVFVAAFGDAFGAAVYPRIVLGDAALFAAAVYLNASMSAALSVRMGNPRFLQIINLFAMSALLTASFAVSLRVDVPWEVLAIAVFLLVGALFTFWARREFGGERITRPVIF